MRFFTFSLLLIFCFNFSLAQPQCDTNRYQHPIFSSVYKHANVKYGEGQVWNIPYNNTDLFMDVYEPVGDSIQKRPLMIWAHPGGFLTGDKEAQDMVALCDSFARRGYVTASIGYRLGFNPLSVASAERAVYRGTQDVRAAIRYLKEFATVYQIDTNSIFLGGSSAGGFAALHVAYLDQNEAPTSIAGDLFSPNLGCLDCSGNTYNHSVELKGIVNLWGALGDSMFINSDETVPALLIHGMADGVVPFGTGHPFGVFTTPIVHGSRAVSNQLNSFGIPHTTHFFPGQDHEPHGTSNGTFDGPPTPYWDTIFNAIKQHYWELLKPESIALIGVNEVCQNEIETYSLATNSSLKTCWEVEGGTILSSSENEISIQWNSVGQQVISYRTFSENFAASDLSFFEVIVNPLPDANFSYNQSLNSFDFSATQTAVSYAWEFAGIGTSTLQNPSFTFPLNGVFVVGLTVTDENGCSSSSEQEVSVSGLSVSAIHANAIRVFPNPAHEFITIDGVDGAFSLVWKNVLGQQLAAQQSNSGDAITIPTECKSGLYWVEIQTATGVVTKQLIVN